MFLSCAASSKKSNGIPYVSQSLKASFALTMGLFFKKSSCSTSSFKNLATLKTTAKISSKPVSLKFPSNRYSFSFLTFCKTHSFNKSFTLDIIFKIKSFASITSFMAFSFSFVNSCSSNFFKFSTSNFMIISSNLFSISLTLI